MENTVNDSAIKKLKLLITVVEVGAFLLLLRLYLKARRRNAA